VHTLADGITQAVEALDAGEPARILERLKSLAA
jgi:hypothetical protein